MGVCTIVLLILVGFTIHYFVQSSTMRKEANEKAANLPNENKLLSIFDDTQPDNLNEMHRLGAKMVFLQYSHNMLDSKVYTKTILTNNALCFKDSTTRYYVTPPSLHAEIKFICEENTGKYTTTKNKSVVGRAVVGGALAGSTGAAIGAASALSGGGTKTVSREYKTGDYHLKIDLSNGMSYVEPRELYISNDLISKIGPLFSNGQKKGPYTMFYINKISSFDINKIIEYTEKAINAR